MPPILVLIITGLLLALVGYLSLQLYISQRILKAFQRAAVVMPSTSESSGLKSGLVMLGFTLLAGLIFTILVK